MTSTIALIERLKAAGKPIPKFSTGVLPPRSLYIEAATELTTLLERCEKAEARVAEFEAERDELSTIVSSHRTALDIAILKLDLDEARKALEWYANPEIYKPHPHGLAFDDRDLSFRARSLITNDREG